MQKLLIFTSIYLLASSCFHSNLLREMVEMYWNILEECNEIQYFTDLYHQKRVPSRWGIFPFLLSIFQTDLHWSLPYRLVLYNPKRQRISHISLAISRTSNTSLTALKDIHRSIHGEVRDVVFELSKHWCLTEWGSRNRYSRSSWQDFGGS